MENDFEWELSDLDDKLLQEEVRKYHELQGDSIPRRGINDILKEKINKCLLGDNISIENFNNIESHILLEYFV